MKFPLQGRSISSKLILYFTNILQHSLKVPQRSIFNIFMFSWVNLLGKVYCSNRLSLRDKCPFPSFSGLYFHTFGLNSWAYLVIILHKREMPSISVRWVMLCWKTGKRQAGRDIRGMIFCVCWTLFELQLDNFKINFCRGKRSQFVSEVWSLILGKWKMVVL